MSEDPPMSEHLAAEIREALVQAERGEVVDLGSFAQYAGGEQEQSADDLTALTQELGLYGEDGSRRGRGDCARHGGTTRPRAATGST